jgi:hypothetical protein
MGEWETALPFLEKDMNEPFAKSTDFISPFQKESIKAHYVYDGTGRITHEYVASTAAVNGQSCLLTRYTYDGVTSRVVGMKEELSTWDETWDI